MVVVLGGGGCGDADGAPSPRPFKPPPAWYLFDTGQGRAIELYPYTLLTQTTPVLVCARFLAERGINIDAVGQTAHGQRRGLYALLHDAGWGEPGSTALMASVGPMSLLARFHRERKLARARKGANAWIVDTSELKLSHLAAAATSRRSFPTTYVATQTTGRSAGGRASAAATAPRAYSTASGCEGNVCLAAQ